VDGKRPDYVLDHQDMIAYGRAATKEFGIDTTKREATFDAAMAESAGEAKPEKLNAAEILSVDSASKKFKVKHKKRELEVGTSAGTVITEGKESAAFEAVVRPGAKVNLELLNGMATAINAKK
jgi:hypothetical protein